MVTCSCDDARKSKFVIFLCPHMCSALTDTAGNKKAKEHKEPASVSVETNKSEDTTTIMNQQNNNNKEQPPATKVDDDENYPENVQSVRERECYRLYQKMSNMGLNVSFDTVLRGMLTPTELRVIQKKKDIALARQATIEQAEEEARAIAEYTKK